MSNEEEAALGIDPALSSIQHDLTAMTRPLRTWTRRLLRFCLWSFATLVALYALLCAWVNWAGARAKEQAFARVAAEGETLDFKALLPPSVDPAKNFFAIEPLKDIALIIENDPEKGEPAKRRKALEAMQVTWKGDRRIAFDGVSLGARTDIETLADVLRNSDFLGQISGSQVAQAMRIALEMRHPLLFELTVELSRTEAEITPAMSQRTLPSNLLTLQLPYLAGPMRAGSSLRLHGVVCAATGDAEAALQDARVLLRLAKAYHREPLLISLLVSCALQRQACDVIWEALSVRGNSDKSLRVLQTELAQNTKDILLQVLRGEMAAASSAMKNAEAENDVSLLMLLDSSMSNGDAARGMIGRLGAGLMPRGYLAWNHASLINAELLQFIVPLKHGGLPALMDSAGRVEVEFQQMSVWRHPHKLMARLAMPAVTNVASRLIAIESQRRQALIACALERYFILHQAYPAVLTDLVPQFIAEVPTDVMDGKPMRYRKTEKDRYVLWAIGFDGKDDGGKVRATPDTVADLYKSNYVGDWAWRYESEE